MAAVMASFWGRTATVAPRSAVAMPECLGVSPLRGAGLLRFASSHGLRPRLAPAGLPSLTPPQAAAEASLPRSRSSGGPIPSARRGTQVRARGTDSRVTSGF